MHGEPCSKQPGAVDVSFGFHCAEGVLLDGGTEKAHELHTQLRGLCGGRGGGGGAVNHRQS